MKKKGFIMKIAERFVHDAAQPDTSVPASAADGTEALASGPEDIAPENSLGGDAPHVEESAGRDGEIALLRREIEELKVSLANAKNRTAAAPAPGGGEGDGFFSPDEVRKMSPDEVREKMPRIRESMMRWK